MLPINLPAYNGGDGGYSCTEWLLTPYNNPQTRSQVRFNEAHRSTRGIIERTFGILKMRFRCLDRSGGAMQYAPEKVAKSILVCCILHNIAIKRGCPLEDEDPIDADDLPEEICVEQANRRGNATRDMVSEQYFVFED
ncbi:putative nuclease HARBI1 [Bombina bombina]|uniref:putative nuclease HARBI1 n=1 Tax=Bombina bombina TaxID=8345 RepID=UPI00235AE22F|nr:putative nuclease HARBI1 [Bombina bombina]